MAPPYRNDAQTVPEMHLALLGQTPAARQREEAEMKHNPLLTYWWLKMAPDGNCPDDMPYPPPFYSTPGQEDRYRRLVELLEECEEENRQMKKLDPKEKSDQSMRLQEEKCDLERGVVNLGGCLQLGDARRELRRVLAHAGS